MPSLEEKPFRSQEESADEPPEGHIRMGHARVRPHVVPFPERTGNLTRADFVTSFLVAWEPFPTPPPHWIELLRQARHRHSHRAGTPHYRPGHRRHRANLSLGRVLAAAGELLREPGSHRRHEDCGQNEGCPPRGLPGDRHLGRAEVDPLRNVEYR